MKRQTSCGQRRPRTTQENRSRPSKRLQSRKNNGKNYPKNNWRRERAFQPTNYYNSTTYLRTLVLHKLRQVTSTESLWTDIRKSCERRGKSHFVDTINRIELCRDVSRVVIALLTLCL